MVNIPDSIDVQGGPITLVFTDNGRVFFSERVSGNIWEIIAAENYKLIKHFDIVKTTGHYEGGLLGIAVQDDFNKTGYIYAYYTEGPDIDHSKNKVVRFNIDDGKEEVLISGIPAGRIHNGGIIAFGPDKKLYIGVGVQDEIKDKSQDKNFLGGKILCINPDGSIPEDNPFPGSPVYSYGHRNIFGLAFHPKTGKLYACDVGPNTDDEINIIEPGGNYGWPIVAGYSDNLNFINPIVTYTPTMTPTQSFFLNDNLYFGSYNYGVIHKLSFTDDGSKVTADKIVYRGKPFGIAGTFISPENEFFIATTDRIRKIKLTDINSQKNKYKSMVWVIIALLVIVLGVIGYFVYGNNFSNNKNNDININQTVTPGTITIQNFSFSPNTLTINVGDTVTWQNNDSTIHRINASDGRFNSGEISHGDKFSYTFTKSGTYNYYCSIHTYMTGVVIVK